MNKIETKENGLVVAGAPVEQALRVERAVRLAEQELGKGDLVEPTRRLVSKIVGKAKNIRKVRG